MSKLSFLSDTKFEVNGIRYAKLTDNTVAVTKRTLKYSGSVTIPESVTYNDINYSVTAIGESAFDGCCELTSVSIPDSVTEIGKYAFLYCSELTSVSIPCSVTEIGESAFDGCGKLSSIDVDSSNSMYCSYESVVFSKDMKTLLICPKGKQGSFEIPDSVTEIGRGAFLDCSELTSVSIPYSITEIGVFAFDGCGKLSSIYVDSGNPMYCSYEGVVFSKDMKILFFVPKGKQGSFEIPDSVTKIGAFAFYDCCRLKSVRIPDSVTEIGYEAFADCSGLTSIRIPDSVAEIGEYAFARCSELTSVSIPNSITKIEYGTFKDCSGLTSIRIPDSVTKIGGQAFSDCSGLKRVSIPDSVNKIEAFAFSDCSGLKRVYIGANVRRIGDESFSDVFQGCKLIEYIAVAAVVPPAADERTFDESVYAKATLRVPEAAIESYKTTEPWSKFATIKPLVKQ